MYRDTESTAETTESEAEPSAQPTQPSIPLAFSEPLRQHSFGAEFTWVTPSTEAEREAQLNTLADLLLKLDARVRARRGR